MSGINYCACGGRVTDGECEHCDDHPAYLAEIAACETGDIRQDHPTDGLNLKPIFQLRQEPPAPTDRCAYALGNAADPSAGRQYLRGSAPLPRDDLRSRHSGRDRGKPQ